MWSLVQVIVTSLLVVAFCAGLAIGRYIIPNGNSKPFFLLSLPFSPSVPVSGANAIFSGREVESKVGDQLFKVHMPADQQSRKVQVHCTNLELLSLHEHATVNLHHFLNFVMICINLIIIIIRCL